MKKILFLLLFAAAFSFANAQNAKPTKEETQKFINNIITQVIGKVPVDNANRQIKSQVFTDDFKIFNRGMTIADDIELSYVEIVSNIQWENLTYINQQANDDLTRLFVEFKSKVECKTTYGEGSISILFMDYIKIYIPTDKIESCKKAFLRLKEIAEEENKDPFQN